MRAPSVARLFILAPVLSLATACSRNEAAPAPPAAAPPRSCRSSRSRPRSVEVSSEWITTLDGYVNAPDPAAGLRLSRQAQLPEGGLVRKGDVLFEIDARLRGRAGAGRGAARRGAGATRTRRAGRRAQHAAREGARDRPEPAGQQHPGEACGAGRRQGGAGRRRRGAAQPRFHQGALARRRRRGDRDGADRRSGRPDDAAHDGLAGRSDPRLFLAQRARVPRAWPRRSTPSRSSDLWQTGGGLQAHARRRHRLPRCRPLSGRRSADRSEDRHDAHQRDLPQSAAACCGPASTAASPSTRARSRARCWCRSVRSPSCRAARRCAWSAPDGTVQIRPVEMGARVGSRWVVLERAGGRRPRDRRRRAARRG